MAGVVASDEGPWKQVTPLLWTSVEGAELPEGEQNPPRKREARRNASDDRSSSVRD
jgi:hypothetical protein